MNISVNRSQALIDSAKCIFDFSVNKTLTAPTYNYSERFKQHWQPKPVNDLVNNTDILAVHKAICQASLLPTVAILREFFSKITKKCETDFEKFIVCVTFAQKHFFHHFAGQPIDFKDKIVFNPVANLILRFGRCGSVAYFLVDLFLCNGIPARLLTGACHTAAEAFIDGKWVLADASLFPPGIYPKDAQGNLLSLEQAIHDPSLLDRVPSYINYHRDFIVEFLSHYPETYASIGTYLEHPILPSVGYFGEDFFSNKTQNLVKRFKKKTEPEFWMQKNNFGWDSLMEEEVFKVKGVKTIQRPSQATNIRIEGEQLIWDGDSNSAVYYELIISRESRGWSYDKLTEGCDFQVDGFIVETDKKYVLLSDILKHGNYVTIVSKLINLKNKPIFYLPSNEFYLF